MRYVAFTLCRYGKVCMSHTDLLQYNAAPATTMAANRQPSIHTTALPFDDSAVSVCVRTSQNHLGNNQQIISSLTISDLTLQDNICVFLRSTVCEWYCHVSSHTAH